MHTQQTAYVNTRSLWVKVYGLDSYPVTKQTLYLDLQHWNHSGWLSLLPFSPAALLSLLLQLKGNLKSRVFHWQVMLFCGLCECWVTGRQLLTCTAAVGCSYLSAHPLQTHFHSVLNEQSKVKWSLVKQNQNKPPTPDHFRLFLFYWLTV